MKKTLNLMEPKGQFIRCDGFNCGSLFKVRLNSMSKAIYWARKQGWKIGKKDTCRECHIVKIPHKA